ncbi:MAG: addiction module HigA family antidote [Halioglobus sp.]|jgi:addiction module HigA family antidote
MIGISDGLLNATTRISPDMANRLSDALGRTPENWLAIQRKYDQWLARTRLKLVGAAKTTLDAT